MDSDFLKKNYGTKNDLVIRNLPLFQKSNSPVNFCDLLGINNSKKILLYQGVILLGRGIKMIFELIQSTDEFIFVIVGGGEKLDYFKNLANEMNIREKVYFVGKIPQDKLIDYTAGAFIGLTLIENVSLSYYYALPNKLFEYMMAGIPIISTKLPQMEKIIEEYKIGFCVQENDIEGLKNILFKLLNDQLLYNEVKNNCHNASKELNWENEIQKFIKKI
jgi:glycosyltransferase involved in cell wall biosynthesis